MTIISRFLLLILLILPTQANNIQAALSRNIKDGEKINIEKKNSPAKTIIKISDLKRTDTHGVQKDHTVLSKSEGRVRYKFKKSHCCLSEKEKKSFKNLKEAEECLKCLLKERKILVGDFYGLNLTAYRYVNIFHRIGYIRYRLIQIDKEIKKTKLEIYELRNKKIDD